MSQSLSPETVAIVKATVPALTEHGAAITRAMYRRLFVEPEIAALFSRADQEDGAQVRALAAAILAYARNIENLAVLGPAVERIAQKHVGHVILPAHYPHVATALLGAIEDVLGEAASPDILTAWGEAYWFLADILQRREAHIRNAIEAQEGGWRGWRRFVIAERVRETDAITSFILRPEDDGRVVAHRAGQYLTFRFDAAGRPGLKRNYSISCGPNTARYRITVKREPGAGASAFLHDHLPVGSVVECAPPAGDFVLADAPERPTVLLSGGVGLTPMVSMLEAIAASHANAPVWYVHATAGRDTHAMAGHVQALAAGHGRVAVNTFYERRADNDDALAGYVTIDWLRANTPFEQADIYLCGPRPFLRALVPGLIGAGVPAAQVHYELFGPMDEVMAAQGERPSR